MFHNTSKSIKYSLFSLIVLLSVSLAGSQDCRAQESRIQCVAKCSSVPGVYLDPHFMADLSVGWRFNEKHFLGLGSGCHWIKEYYDSDPDSSNGFVPAIPLYADYIRYYPFAKQPKHSFFLGMEAGGAYYFNKMPLKYDNMNRVFPYLNGKWGFDFGIIRHMDLIIGFNLVCGFQRGLLYGGHGIALDIGIKF